MDFGRVITAMVTPFNDEMKLDLEKARKLAVYLIANGSDALVVGGTTGESPTLTKEEKLSLFELVKDVAQNKAKVIAGTGSYSTEESIKLTKEAEKIGLDGVMLVVPYYNRPTQKGLFEHFKAIATTTNLPVMLYNVPSRTGRNMEPETVSKLAQIPNIVALKEAAGDMDQVSALRGLLAPDFAIYSGDDSLTLPMMALGAKGVVSVASHIVGNQLKQMINAFTNGQINEALAIHLSLMPLFKALFIVTNPVPVKTALNMVGLDVGGVRLPLVAAGETEIKVLQDTLEKLNLHKRNN
ncbi:MAG: 4-hydroxy-tetrahydrodipicolinate synthase [Bacillota bacterium]